MKKIKFNIHHFPLRIAIFCYFISAGCNERELGFSYPKNTKLSDSQGAPLNSNSYYFPFEINDSITGIDSLANRVYSSMLVSFKEPVLCNYYLNNDIYRLMIIESWKPVKVIKFIKSGKDMIVTIKIFDSKDYNFFPMAHEEFVSKEDGSLNRKKYVKFSFRKIIIHRGWEGLAQKIETSKYWKFKCTDKIQGTDGTRIILEGHTKDNYLFVSRWQAGQYDNNGKGDLDLLAKDILGCLEKLKE